MRASHDMSHNYKNLDNSDYLIITGYEHMRLLLLVGTSKAFHRYLSFIYILRLCFTDLCLM